MAPRHTPRRAAAVAAIAATSAALLSLASPASPAIPRDAPIPPEGEPAAPGAPAAPEPVAAGTPAVALPPDAEKEAPYSGWKTHVGKAEEGVALLRMRGPGGADFTVMALVARCDGFLLVPYSALERRAEGAAERGAAGSPILVSVGPCEGDAPQRALAAVSVYQPRAGTRHRPPFGLLKVNGPHLRSVPLLGPAALKPGTPLRVVWAEAAPEAAAAPAGPPASGKPDATAPARSRAARHCFAALAADPPPDPDAPRRSPVEWALADLKPAEGVPEDAAPSLPPLGAVVVDDATGAAVGVVTGQRDGKALFASFLYLHDLTNELALAPTREAARDRLSFQAAELQAERRDTRTGMEGVSPKSGDMTWVRGGPVRLYGYLLERYRTRYKTDVACTPGFWADALPVANKEYREFAARESSGGKSFTLPWGWKESGELQSPFRWDTLPVNGVRPEEAALYAARQGKRLLTPVEFVRASKNSYGPWVQRTYADWRGYENALARMERDVARILALFDEFDEQRTYARILPGSGPSPRRRAARRGAGPEGALTTDSGGGGAANVSPAGAVDPRQVAAAALLAGEAQNLVRTVSRVLDEYTLASWHPWQVAAVGWRADDVSEFGVRDVVMNAPELVQPVWVGKQYDSAPKLSPARRDPYLDTPVVTGYGFSGYMHLPGGLPPEVGHLMVTLRKAKFNVGYGFRCAR